MSLRALDTDEPLVRYLEIKAEIERLTEELDEIKPQITEALEVEPEQRCLALGCEITLGIRKTYRYSDGVRRLEKTLKEAKLLERMTGEAAVIRATAFPVVTRLKTEEAA